MPVLARLGDAFSAVSHWLEAVLRPRRQAALRHRRGSRRRDAHPGRRRAQKVGSAQRSGSASPPARAPSPISTQRSDVAAAEASLAVMRDALRALLDEHAGNRQVFKHLAAFEHMLARKGLAVLERLPARDLQRALAEFESMVRNWSSTGLAELRSRMAVALSDRRSAASMWIAVNSVQAEARPRRSGAEPGGRSAARVAPIANDALDLVDVADVSASRFEAAGGEWKRDSRQAALET